MINQNIKKLSTKQDGIQGSGDRLLKHFSHELKLMVIFSHFSRHMLQHVDNDGFLLFFHELKLIAMYSL